MIISDDGVPSSIIEKIKLIHPAANFYIFKQGEESKSLLTYEKILSELTKLNFDRHDLIIALGGGVVGDLSLFVGSTYKRGIEVILIPTTTLAMCDSCIGGKCGVNLNGIKNVVGSFYQPALVLIDLDFLATLDQRNYHNGLCEALKMGMIYNENLFNYFLLNTYQENIEQVIYLSLMAKKYFIEQDEKEQSLRKALNFGHTLGHALESYYQYSKYLHGEAIGYGMLKMVNGNVKNNLLIALKNLNLDFQENVSLEQLFPYLQNDKKVTDDAIDIVLVNKIGSYEIKRLKLNDLFHFLKEKYYE
jgi:3-dehydroquinate synthase